MKTTILLAFLFAIGPVGRAADPAPLPIESQVAEAVKSSRVTIVHFWAPWCPNCRAELAGGGWSGFIAANPGADVIFVTTWNPEDGKDLLERNGVGAQSNFRLLLHPNGSRRKDGKMSAFMGLPVSWIPTTWVFRDGKLRYALNYGELRFPMLQQLVRDASDTWEH